MKTEQRRACGSAMEPIGNAYQFICDFGFGDDGAIRNCAGFQVRLISLTEQEGARLLKVNASHDLRARLLRAISTDEMRARRG